MNEVRKDALLNGRQCAESIGISQQAFLKWKVPGEKSGREKLYKLRDVLAVYRERVRRELDKEIRAEIAAEPGDDGLPDSPSMIKVELDKERVRLTREQADAQELKNEVARHEVAPFSYITYVLAKTANEIAGVMDSLPIELMRKLSLQAQDVEKVKMVTALASDSIVKLADEEFLEGALDEFIAKADQ